MVGELLSEVLDREYLQCTFTSVGLKGTFIDHWIHQVNRAYSYIMNTGT